MGDFDHIERCIEIAESDLVTAIESRAGVRALLQRAAAVSRPGDGGPKVLLLFARLAAASCEWLDGDLHVAISGDDASCTIDVLVDIGAGLKERVVPASTLSIPIGELTRAVERHARVLAPLEVSVPSEGKVVLRAPSSHSIESIPPIEVEGLAEPPAKLSAPPSAPPIDTRVLTPPSPMHAAAPLAGDAVPLARVRLRQRRVRAHAPMEEVVDSSRHVDVTGARTRAKEDPKVEARGSPPGQRKSAKKTSTAPKPSAKGEMRSAPPRAKKKTDRPPKGTTEPPKEGAADETIDEGWE